MKTYKAYHVEQTGEKEYTGAIKELSTNQLPEGDVLVRVKYSSLNYKDALSASGNRGVTKTYPHTPGIDAAGIVEASITTEFKPGDEVIVTSYDLGMNTSGGFGQYIRVPAGWVVKLPDGLSLRESMALGTAGFTAGMAVAEIEKEINPGNGPVLVTGATGGVGSLAVSVLAKLGYEVAGVTGKESAHDYLKNLGASTILTREQALEKKERPIFKPRWAGVVDTVGGDILANAIKSATLNGVVTACGNVASPDLPINVFPFILRGVKLIGIDSQNCEMPHREKIWKKLAEDWKPEHLFDMTREINLDDLPHEIDQILKGKMQGRVFVKL